MARLTYEVPFVPNTITAYAYKDPWFALGNLIGRAWANNYNERGINKLIDSMEGSIPGQQTDQGAANSNLMNAALNSAGTDNQDSIAGLQKAIDSMKQGQPLPMSDYSGLGQAIGQSQADPQMMQNALANKNTNGVMDALGQAAVNNGYDGLESSVGKAYGDVMNLRQSPAQAAAQAASQAQGGPAQPFDMNNWIAQMKAEGRRQGRPDYQIEEAIRRMQPNAEAALYNYNKQNADAIEAEMFRQADAGDYGGLAKNYVKLSKYDPDRAQVWGKTIPGFSDFYNEGNTVQNSVLSYDLADRNAARASQRRMAEDNNNAKNSRQNAEFNIYLRNKYGGTTSGSSGSSSSGSGSSSGGGSPNQYQMMGNNMLNAAASVFRGADRDQIAKVTSDLVGFLDAINEDPEKKAKYNPSILNMIQEAAYTGNALREYLDGHYDASNQYANSVSKAGSYFAQFLPSNRIKQ